MAEIEDNLEAIQFNWAKLRTARLNRLFDMIEAAYLDGMSVLDIKRSLGSKTVKSVLTTLVIRKAIPPLPSGSGRIRYSLPTGISIGLDRIDYPFIHWCLVNGFDPKEAASALRIDPDQLKSDTHRKIHQVASEDIPIAYAQEYGTEPPEYNPGYTRELIKPSVSLIWNQDKQQYVSISHDAPEVKACGRTLIEAFDRMRHLLDIEKQINRLDAAIARYKSENS